MSETNKNPMGELDKAAIKYIANDLLFYTMTSNYSKVILENILPDIIEDVAVSASPNWNTDDVRLAIGRILCKKLGLDF